MSAYTQMVEAIKSVKPVPWRLTEYEPVEDAIPDSTEITLKVSRVTKLPAAPFSHYQIDWIITLTTEYPSRQTADPQLFDDLITFLTSLLGVGDWLEWAEAEKVVGSDLQRLAYDITVRAHHDISQ